MPARALQQSQPITAAPHSPDASPRPKVVPAAFLNWTHFVLTYFTKLHGITLDLLRWKNTPLLPTRMTTTVCLCPGDSRHSNSSPFIPLNPAPASTLVYACKDDLRLSNIQLYFDRGSYTFTRTPGSGSLFLPSNGRHRVGPVQGWEDCLVLLCRHLHLLVDTSHLSRVSHPGPTLFTHDEKCHSLTDVDIKCNRYTAITPRLPTRKPKD